MEEGGSQMMKHFQPKLIALLLILIMVTVSACSPGHPSGTSNHADSGENKETLYIGALFPRSGNLAPLGIESFRGAELARLEQNQAGGLLGKTVAFKEADAPSPNAAQAEADRLINKEKITAILGSYSSSISMAASQVAEKNRVIYWEGGAVSTAITSRGFKYVFRTQPNDTMSSRDQAQFVADELTKSLNKPIGNLKIMIVHEDSEFGTSGADRFKKAIQAVGAKAPPVYPYNAQAKDLTSIVLKIKDAQPDILFAVSYVTDGILLTRQMLENKVEVPVFLGAGAGYSLTDYAKALGNDKVEGNISFDVPQFTTNPKYTPGMDHFIEAYKKQYGEEPHSAHSLIHYWSAKLLFQTIEKAESVEPDKIREAVFTWDQPEGQSPTGWGIKFGEDGQNQRGNLFAHQWRDGKMIVVWPRAAALSEFTLE